MNIIDLISISNIIDYVYSFSLIFCICVFGSFIKDCYDAIKKIGKINILRVIVSSSFSAFCLCFIFSYVTVSFPALVFICFLVGIWSSYIMDAMFNIKVVFIVLKSILSQMSSPISKGVGAAMQELQDDEKKKNSNKEKEDDKKETKDE